MENNTTIKETIPAHDALSMAMQSMISQAIKPLHDTLNSVTKNLVRRIEQLEEVENFDLSSTLKRVSDLEADLDKLNEGEGNFEDRLSDLESAIDDKADADDVPNSDDVTDALETAQRMERVLRAICNALNE
jgi:chromosome segregation ATPase